MRCNERLPSSHFKTYHDVLVHYDTGKNVFEENPINYPNFGEIRKYEITFTQYSDDYDFFNAEKLVDEYLLNVKNRAADQVVIFSLNVVFLWKIFNRRLLTTNSQ